MKPFGVLTASLIHFGKSLPLALGLAITSTAATVGMIVALGLLASRVGLSGGGEGAAWSFAISAWIVFTHSWLVLFLTAWRLRRETPGFRYGAAVARAATWAVGFTVVLALVFLGLTLVPRGPEDFTVGPPPSRWHPAWLAVMAVWAAICGFGLPARAMLGRHDRKAGLSDVAAIVIAIAPWLAVVDFLSLPARTCQGECWGFMDGGLFMLPLLGLWLFLLTTAAAAVSAAAWSRTVRV